MGGAARERPSPGGDAGGAPRLRRQRPRAADAARPAGPASGSCGPTSRRPRSRLAAILREERADVLLTYDRNGGYGHRDHVKVHEVGARAASLASTPRVLQATVPRDTICRAIALAGRFYRFPPEFDPSSFQRAFSPRSEITHRIGVRRHIRAKRASMRAHASQATADGGADRTLAAFLRIPRPLYDLVFGREWFVDPAAPARGPRLARHLRGAGMSGRVVEVAAAPAQPAPPPPRPGGADAAPGLQGLVGLAWPSASSSGPCRTSPRRRGTRCSRCCTTWDPARPSACWSSCRAGCGSTPSPSPGRCPA